MHQLIAVLLAMAAPLFCGCALNTYNATTGSGDPEAPRAIITPKNNLAISSIDGKNVFITDRNWWIPMVTKTKAAVIPGTHVMTIKYARTGWLNQGCRATINVQPGRTFFIKGKRLPVDCTQGFTAVKKPQTIRVIVWVEDEAGNIVIDEAACQPYHNL